ncbi:hypothetical protein D1BOALGB6SA_168 [Olavius sp. associated proteobacterium Delta 1]|nr:hypothetical protein D1BOALGB6SA_168 [Olavius sp. associated proteobacterium Delta 1]
MRHRVAHNAQLEQRRLKGKKFDKTQFVFSRPKLLKIGTTLGV